MRDETSGCSVCACVFVAHLQLYVHRLSFALLGLAQPRCYPLGSVGGALIGHLLFVHRQLVALHHDASANTHTHAWQTCRPIKTHRLVPQRPRFSPTTAVPLWLTQSSQTWTPIMQLGQPQQDHTPVGCRDVRGNQSRRCCRRKTHRRFRVV